MCIQEIAIHSGHELIDEDTENWPLSSQYRGNLDEIKHQYQAVPLPAYATDNFWGQQSQ